jgi:acyl carrier protein
LKTESEVKKLLRDWIVAKKPGLEQVGDDAPLIEQRIITSLQVMDLLLYIEQLTDKPLDAADLKPGSFKDINTIYSNFFEAGHDD